MNVYIEVEGGVVQSVYTDNESLANVHVVVVDYDNINAGDDKPETPNVEQCIPLY